MLEEQALVPVTWRNLPLVGKPQQWAVIEGTSLAEMVEMCPDLPIGFEEDGVICVNGEPIPRRMWKYVRPKVRNRDVVVTLHVSMGHGSSGKIFRTVALIAVMALALVAGPFVTGALTASLGAGLASIAGGLTAAAISVGGSLLINALAPPPSNPQANSGPATGTSLTQASLQGNVLRAGESLPRILGVRRCFPPFICQPVVELIDRTEYIEAVYGLAGPHQIQDIFVADTSLINNTVPDVSYQVCEGLPGSAQQTLVQRQGFVVTPNITMSKHIVTDISNGAVLLDQSNPTIDLPFFHRLITRNAFDEFWISVNIRELIRTDNGASVGVPFRVRIRPAGTTVWTNLPEFHVTDIFQEEVPFTIKLMRQTAPGGTPIQGNSYRRGVSFCYFSVPAQNVIPTESTSPWTASTYFWAGSGDNWYDAASDDNGSTNAGNFTTTGIRNVNLYKDRIEFYLDPVSFPAAIYEVEVCRGTWYQFSDFGITNYTNAQLGTGSVADYFFYRNTAPAELLYTTIHVNDETQITRATSIWNQPPAPQGVPIAQVAVKAHGRSVQALSVLAGAYVPVAQYNSSGVITDWTNTLGVSDNPADHYRDVLLGSLASFPLQAQQIDDLSSWRNACIANGYSINTVVQNMKQMDVLLLIAAAGYARPIQSETWGVAQDFDRSALLPTQIFTPRNLTGFKWTRTFAPFIDGFRVRFDDVHNSHTETEVVVLDPEAQTTGERLEDIRYEVIVENDSAVRRALFDLKQARRRLVNYQGTADIENLVCRQGDLVGLSYDVIDEYNWAARVSRAVSTTQIQLDDNVPDPLIGLLNVTGSFLTITGLFLYDPLALGVCIRGTDGSMSVRQVTAIDSTGTLLTLASTISTSVVTQGCLVTAGPLGHESRRVLVQAIKPKKDLTADLVFVDEAPDLFSNKLVSLLCHLDSASNFDSSSYAHTGITNNGGNTIDTTNKVFGAGSMSFGGSNNAALTIPEAKSEFASNTDFTVDFWAMQNQANSPVSQTLGTLCVKGGATFPAWMFRIDSTTNTLRFYSASEANNAFDIANGVACGTLPALSFRHIALTRLGQYFYIYIQGILQLAFFSPLNLNQYKGNIALGWFSNDGSSVNNYRGNIDEFRYTNGFGRWWQNSFIVPGTAGTPV